MHGVLAFSAGVIWAALVTSCPLGVVSPLPGFGAFGGGFGPPLGLGRPAAAAANAAAFAASFSFFFFSLSFISFSLRSLSAFSAAFSFLVLAAPVGAGAPGTSAVPE